MDTKSVGASLFQGWYLKLGCNLLKQKLGDDLFEHYFCRSLFMNCFHLLALPALLESPMAFWFDGESNSNIERRDDLVRLSLQECLEELESSMGEDMAKWRWGQLHQVTFRHPLGRWPGLGEIFNVGPKEIPGDEHTINQGGFNYRGKFEPRVVPGFRQIVDLGDLSNSILIYSPGQSGQPGSKHYADFVEDWAEVKYHPMLFDRDLIERACDEVLVLIPN